MSDAISAFGTLLKIGDGAVSESFTTIAEVKDIDGPGFETDIVDVTNHSSAGAWEEDVATILRGGEVTFDVNFVPTGATHAYDTGLIYDFLQRTRRNFQLVFPDSGNTTWQFTAIVQAFQIAAPVAEELRASVTLKITGQPTLA